MTAVVVVDVTPVAGLVERVVVGTAVVHWLIVETVASMVLNVDWTDKIVPTAMHVIFEDVVAVEAL